MEYGKLRHKYKTTNIIAKSDKEGIDNRSSKVVAAIGSRNKEQRLQLQTEVQLQSEAEVFQWSWPIWPLPMLTDDDEMRKLGRESHETILYVLLKRER